MFYPQQKLIINIEAIKKNFLTIKNFVKEETIVSADLKSSAYYIGSKVIANSLYEIGCRDFWVTCLNDALDIRQVLESDANIYILQGFRSEDKDILKKYNFIQVINSIEEFNEAKVNSLRLVLHIDTGLRMLGINPYQLDQILMDLKNECIEYIISNLACTNSHFDSYNIKQKKLFDEILLKIRQIIPVKSSLSDSNGVFSGPEYQMDLVRISSFLYGIQPTYEAQVKSKNVISLESYVLQKYLLKQGESIGYNRSFVCSSINMKIAIISGGYGDGIPEDLSNKGIVLFYDLNNEQYRAPIVGSISTDLLACDITNIPDHLTEPGCKAILIDENYSINEIAKILGKDPREILINLHCNSSRAQVIYKD